MAYMNQQKKQKIAAALRQVVPAGWKYSLAVDNYSTIVMTIQQAPVNLLAHVAQTIKLNSGGRLVPQVGESVDVNHYHLGNQFHGGLLETFEKINAALNLDNHDNSDIMTDYHDVGHYVSIKIGRWNKPFRVSGKVAA